MDENLIKAVIEAIQLAVTNLPKDIVNAIEKAYEREESKIAKFNLENILKAIEISKSGKIPICQDTGTITFFVEAGIKNPYLGEIREILVEATRRATQEIPLRPNAVDILTNKNSGDNTGRFIPIIHWELVNGDEIKIAVLPKGGGSENCSALAMLNPSEGFEGVKRFVVERVRECEGKPCPPIVLGIGIGGSADLALKLAKKSLLRPLGIRHENEIIARLEREILDEVNSLGIGPMGMGGRTTALDVKIEYAHRHPASLPVGLIVQCWAHRKAFIEIDKEGRVKIWQ
ncbi:fumarate hydratase [Thermococcus sp. M39]|uniref:fumarate hydratase n=1 Tax=unclassified Thermococcus TaxID=2627626 RepID=UPI0014388213|nr:MULTISPECIES: fumarate hydratase [unclassified Thermococcus]NJE08115.1 fumarate hydratase [Thermococcus sp. M39]NJE11608.1 fumarate hydratase [Thermococcus sp. LS2]